MSSRKLTVKTENWSEEPFAISRGSDNNFDVVVVELEQNGCRGCGEATPTEHNQESVSQSEMLIENIRSQLEEGLSRTELQQMDECMHVFRVVLPKELAQLQKEQKEMSRKMPRGTATLKLQTCAERQQQERQILESIVAATSDAFYQVNVRTLWPASFSKIVFDRPTQAKRLYAC